MTVARTIATMLLLCGLALAAAYLFANAPSGTFGFTSTFATGRAAVRVDAVVPGGAAARAGVRSGDVIIARVDAPHDRAPLYLFANAPLVADGDRVLVSLTGAAGARTVLIEADRDRAVPAAEALYFVVLGLPLLLLGWFIAWRKADNGDAVTLGVMVLLFGLWIVTPDRVGGPIARLALYEIAGSAFVIAAILAAALSFARYPGDGLRRSHLRRALAIVVIVVSAAEMLTMTLSYVLPAYVGATPWLNPPLLLFVVIPPLATLLCVLDAFRHGDAAQRTRLCWLGGSFFAGMSGPLLLPAVTVLLGSNFTVLDQALLESTMFVLAFGLTYGILRRRVVDVAFVLNRALVFSIVSSIVIAAFIGIETLIGSLFVHLSRTTSLLIELGTAVVIGFTLRPIHGYVDGFIDRFFFAKRHAAERAIHHLATEVHFIRDRGTLLERVERDLLAHTDARVVSVYFREDVRGNFLLLRSTSEDAAAFIDADDDAAVALAVNEAPVELHRRRTHVPGELAVPLAVRKTLLGILVMGEKASGEAYAPNEVESLRFLAAYLGTALAANVVPDAADDPQGGVLREILAEMRLQREALRALSDAMSAAAAGTQKRPRR